MLVTSIFSFSHVFYPYERQISSFLEAFDLSSANAIYVDLAKILSFGEKLNRIDGWEQYYCKCLYNV